VRRVGDQSGAIGQGLGAHRCHELIALFGCPFVQPDDRRAQRLACGIARHHSVDLATETHRDDSIRLHSVYRRADRLAKRCAVRVRVLVGPAVAHMGHGQRRRAGRHDLATLVDDHGLDGL
jgi:hypothetical protein